MTKQEFISKIKGAVDEYNAAIMNINEHGEEVLAPIAAQAYKELLELKLGAIYEETRITLNAPTITSTPWTIKPYDTVYCNNKSAVDYDMDAMRNISSTVDAVKKGV